MLVRNGRCLPTNCLERLSDSSAKLMSSTAAVTSDVISSDVKLSPIEITANKTITFALVRANGALDSRFSAVSNPVLVFGLNVCNFVTHFHLLFGFGKCYEL